MFRKYLFATLLSLLALQALAQIQYPTTVSLTVKPSAFLSDYAEPGSGNFAATITFNDMNEVGRDVYFRICIESNRVKLFTSLNYRPQPITLYTAEPLTLSDMDFEDYFNLRNLECMGADRDKLQRYGQIPEGLYKFSLEVIEYQTGKIISRKQPVVAKVELKEPPLISAPAKGALLKSSEPQFTLSWRQADPTVNVSNTSYTLKLYEIDPSEQNPLLAINNHTARELYVSDPVKNLLYTYDLSHPVLEPGMRYAFTITAQDDGGKPRFKNNGQSEVGWFHYGYPVGGSIQLNYPPNNSAFTRFDVPNLLWEACSNIVNKEQQVVYKAKVVTMQEDDDTTWVMQNPEFYSYTSPPLMNNKGSNTTIPYELGHLQHFAWQVTAESDGVEIGRSEVRTFTGPPKIESFFIENHEVFITKVSSLNMDRFSGEGKVKVNKDGTMLKVKFDNLKIRANIGIFTCDSGMILCKVENFKDIDLTPHPDYEINRHAIFVTDSVRLSQDGLFLKGRVIWDYSLASKNKQKQIISAQQFVNYNDYTLAGQVFFDKDERFELLEPANYKMNLSRGSSFLISADIWSPDFSGSVEVNSNVKGRTTEVYQFPFFNIRQLFYNTTTYVSAIDEIVFTPKANVFLLPTTVTFDFSENRSPEKFETVPDWKGVYIDNFNLRLAADADQSNQLKPLQENVLSYSILEKEEIKAWVNGNGLEFFLHHGFDQAAGHFCTFPTALNEIKLSVLSSNIREGYIRGSMYIPLISETELYTWHLPLSMQGFGTGYLDETNERLSFVFAKNDAESKLNVKVKRAQFAGNNRLSLDLEIEYPLLGLTFKDIGDFCIWGNKEIGVKVPEGILSLTNRQQAVYKTYSINLNRMGAGRICEQYVFGFDADIAMGEAVTGGSGAPVMNLYASMKNSHLTEPCNKSVQNIKTPEIYANNGGYELKDSPVGEDNSGGNSLEAEVEAQNKFMSERIAASEAISDALDSLSIEVPVTQFKTERLIADTSIQQTSVNGSIVFPEDNTIVVTPEFLKSLLDLLILFVDEEQGKELEQLKKNIEKVESNDLYQFYQKIKNGEAFERFINDGVSKVVVKITSPVTNTCNTVKQYVNNGIVTAENKAFAYFDSIVNVGFKAVETGVDIAVAPYPDLADLAKETLRTTKDAIVKEIKDAVVVSVQRNIQTPINMYIDTSINGRIVGFVDSTLRRNANRIISGELKSITMDEMVNDAKSALTGIGEDTKNFFSFENIGNMMKNTGNDIIREISWNDIKNDIVDQLLKEGSKSLAKAIVADGVNALLPENAAEEKTITVKDIAMDFGSMLSGTKTSSMHITFNTPVADGEGYVDFYTGDPLYGNVWHGNINASIKVGQRFDAYALFLNGTTTTDEENKNAFKFWYLEFGVANIRVPLSPVPLTMIAANGRVYEHMNRPVKEQPYVPDAGVKFGAGVHAWFVDAWAEGSIMALDVDLGLKVLQNGFELGMLGNVSISNKIITGNMGAANAAKAEKFLAKSLIVGTGSMVFSTVDHSFYANAKVTTNTQPLLCTGGEFNAYITPDDWKLSVGTRQDPMQVKLLCRDFIKMGGWFEVGKSYLDIGLFQNVDLNLTSPWLGPKACRARVWAKFKYDFGVQTLVCWKPSIKVKEAAVWLEALMAVGADYKTFLGSGSLTFAAIHFKGNLIYKSEETESTLSGTLYGKVTIMNVNIGVDMQTNKKFS